MNRSVKIFLTAVAFLFAIYITIIFVIPYVLNSDKFKSYVVQKIERDTKLDIKYENINFNITPLLKCFLNVDKIEVYKDNEKLFNVRGLRSDFRPLSLKNDTLYINEVYLQKNNLFSADNNKSLISSFNPLIFAKNLPDLHINKILIEYGGFEALTTKIDVSELNLSGKDERTLTFKLNMKSLHLTKDISISNDSKIVFTPDVIYTNDYKIYFGNSFLNITGVLYSNSGSDFLIKGNNLPAGDIERSFILVNRCVKNKKHFLENFRDFKGDMNVNLKSLDGDIKGNILIKNLSAVSKPLSVPMSFPKANFIFDKKDIYMQSKGKLGMEDVFWTFYMTGIFTDKLVISGNVSSLVSDKFAKKYIEGLKIKDILDLNVEYFIKNGIVSVIYTALLPKNSDISYFDGHLGLSDFNRKFQAITKKDGDKISLINYEYSLNEQNAKDKMIFGTGEFEKINGKYTLTKLFCKTMKNAPVSLLSFLDDRLESGYFNGEFEYDFIKNQILGSIILENSKFKCFKIKNAAVFGDENDLTILSNGTYRGEVYSAELIMNNEFNRKVFNIKNLNLYLKKLVLNGHKNTVKISPKDVAARIEIDSKILKKYPKVNAKSITLKLDRFIKNKAVAENILVHATINNNILNFSSEGIDFAKGKIFVKGYMNPDKRIMDAEFEADNIDSATVSNKIFNLKEQISGKASAKFHIITRNRLQDVKGEGEFRIQQGELIRLLNLNKENKINLSKIIKVKNKTQLNPKSNIYGNFKIDNSNINDINIYMQNDAISLFAKGNYNIDTESANLHLWGKYDDSVAKNVKIYHIPLNILSKLIFKASKFMESESKNFEKVPSIFAKEKYITKFIIKLKGNINNPKTLTKELLRIK